MSAIDIDRTDYCYVTLFLFNFFNIFWRRAVRGLGHGSDINLDWHPKGDPTQYRQCVPNKVSDVCI